MKSESSGYVCIVITVCVCVCVCVCERERERERERDLSVMGRLPTYHLYYITQVK